MLGSDNQRKLDFAAYTEFVISQETKGLGRKAFLERESVFLAVQHV